MEELSSQADKDVGTDSQLQRRPVTCERCKRLKTRCDRRTPSCKRCSDAQLPCDYSSRRKPGFPAGYRQGLEDKISALQAEVEVLRNRNQEEGRALRPAPPARDSSAVDGANLGSSLSPCASTGSTARSAIDRMPLATSFRTKQVAESKPPADLVFSLVSLYFVHIHPWMPFLDIRRIFHELSKGEEPPPLCHALFGISLPFSFDSRLTQAACDSYWKYSKRRILIDVLEEPSFLSLEALAVLVLDLSGMTNGPQVWGALAIAVKLAIQLKTLDGRALRASTTEEAATWQQSPTIHRQRLFWVIYMLDSYISITTSHPSGLSDYHVSHFLPNRDSVWMAHETENEGVPDVPSLGCVFNYQLRLMDVSRMVHDTYLAFVSLPGGNETQIPSWLERFGECSRQLDGWAHSLPADMAVTHAYSPSSGTTTLASLTMMRTYYHGLVLLLHGLVAFSGQPELHDRFEAYRPSSVERCSNSIDAIVSTLSSISTQGMAKFGWPLAWSIWIAARYVLVAQHYGCQFPPQTSTSFLDCLEQLAKYWQIAGKYWRLLRQARDEQQSGIVYEGGVLHFVVNQKLATSDLEDRFRIDSFFTDAATNPTSATASRTDSMGLQAPSQQDTAGTLLTQDLFVEENESWFLNRLNPSSAYQVAYPEFFEGGI